MYGHESGGSHLNFSGILCILRHSPNISMLSECHQSGGPPINMFPWNAVNSQQPFPVPHNYQDACEIECEILGCNKMPNLTTVATEICNSVLLYKCRCYICHGGSTWWKHLSAQFMNSTHQDGRQWVGKAFHFFKRSNLNGTKRSLQYDVILWLYVFCSSTLTNRSKCSINKFHA